MYVCMYIAVLMFSKTEKREEERYEREGQHARCCFKGTSRSETRINSADQIKEASYTTNQIYDNKLREIEIVYLMIRAAR